MELVQPGIGLIFWTTITFLILLYLLGRFAWKPILGAVRKREHSIKEALASAEKAREEMAQLKSENEKILQEARNERDEILKDARSMREKMIADAKSQANTEADKMIESAREQIQNEKMRAVTDLKNLVGSLSIEIAEKILRQELDNPEKQKELVNRQLEDFKLN